MGISALLASQILDASATGRSVITGADASAIRTTLGLGTLATQSATITDYLTIASAASTYQPLDSDLTSIAALSTTAFGRGLLTEASATTARSTLGLGTLATQSPTGTPSASTFLRGDFSWQTIDLSGYVPYSGATGAVNLGANAFTASRATLATGTITASTPALNVTQTWNNAATTFTGILSNVTDTASNANSLLMDLQVGGTSRVAIRKDGNISIGGAYNLTSAGFVFSVPSGGGSRAFTIQDGGTQTLAVSWNGLISYGAISMGASIVAPDVHLIRDAAGILALRNGVYGTTTAQTFRVYNTFTDASNYERAKIAWESNVLRIGTEKAGTGSARALELQTDGTTRVTVGNTGNVGIGGSSDTTSVLRVVQSNKITNDWGNLAIWTSNAQAADIGGSISLGGYNNNAATNLCAFASIAGRKADGNTGTTSGYLQFGVTNSLGNILEVARFTSTELKIADALNIAVGTTTGTKIGTATTQKLGFYNATPVVQPTAVADATDAASVITQLNALLSRMRDLGLIAT